MLSFFPRRAIHLDFHTSPAIGDVGRDFDPDRFAQTMADAHVDSVTVFAKCHHGHLYYPTSRPERHPGLPEHLDLLGDQIAALHKRGIRAPIYISVQVDCYAADHHPEWIAVEPDGRLSKFDGPFGTRWPTMDMSTPYQDYLAEQVAEVLERFTPTDGIFLDMCWDQPSVSMWAQAGMRRHGYDPRDEADRARYAREVAHAYMRRFKKMVDTAHKAARPVGIWFNSRPMTNLQVEKQYLRHVEIECLPTGGWGYARFPYVSRFVRPLGLPTLAMTGRFHKSWGDFGGVKPEAALLYECCSALNQGLSCSVGDQMHPRGHLEKAAYETIGRVYRYIETCEPYVAGATPVSEIAVLIDPAQGDDPGPACLGVVRLLQELRHQFDLVSVNTALTSYKVVVVPENITVDAALAQTLRAYLQAGGALILSANASLAIPEANAVSHGPSPFSVTYVRPAPPLASQLPETDFVLYEPGLRLTPKRGAQALAQVVEPYFERTYEHFCSHSQTPPDTVSAYAAVIQAGRVISFAAPLFTAYGDNAYPPYRRLFGACLDRLLPEPLIRDGGPVHLEATVLRKGKRTVVGLLSFYPMRKTRTGHPEMIEDAFPLVDMPLSVRLDRAPKRVVSMPSGETMPCEYRNGRAHVRVSNTTGHALLLFE